MTSAPVRPRRTGSRGTTTPGCGTGSNRSAAAARRHDAPLRRLLFLLVLAATALAAQPSAVVLCYHTFLDRPDIDTDISPAAFEEHLAALEAAGWTFVSWPELRDGRLKGRRNILITIDDANRSVLNIRESLRRRGIRPVLFVYPAIPSRVSYALTWDELRDLAAEGATIGGHGYNHLVVNRKLHDTDPQAFRREIHLCHRRIGERIGRPPDVYAYPFGVFDDLTKEHLRQAGFRAAFTIRHGRTLSPLAANPDPYELPRYIVAKSSWPGLRAFLTATERNR